MFFSSLFLLVGLVIFAWVDPEGFTRQLAKDADPGGAGAFEHLTVLFLLPGIAAGLFAYWRWRERLPHRHLRTWLLLWSLACIYFAGEEVSWGQWFFGWGTPDALAKVNDQGETNLHNISSWFDQKPRTLVEMFIVASGLLMPLWQVLRKTPPRSISLHVVEAWIVAPVALIPAGLLLAVVKVCGWLPMIESFGSRELGEFAIAWFLGWYLVSYAVRLSRLQGVEDP